MPALDWDGQNPAREDGERQLAALEQNLSVARGQLSVEKPGPENLKAAREKLKGAEEAVRKLRAISKPFLNWAGKAERLSFEVPTLPLFVHERLSTKAIVETLSSHRRERQMDMLSLFGDPQHSFTDQVLRAYEHRDRWVNRMILGDSLVVMNSLLHYEGLGGQVQMIYMDPPYGVKFGSNFQPFVRKRDVTHNGVLDTDYNGLCFHVSQAFFPRTSAWDNLKKALKGEYEESVWDHLSGTTSAPFEAGEHRQVAVKVIDDRGNELMVVEKLA